jgi:hypothetical protein
MLGCIVLAWHTGRMIEIDIVDTVLFLSMFENYREKKLFVYPLNLKYSDLSITAYLMIFLISLLTSSIYFLKKEHNFLMFFRR